MVSAARNQHIPEAYNVRTGSKLETFQQVNEGARFGGIRPRAKNKITMAEVNKWYLENDTGALKYKPVSTHTWPLQGTTSCKSICLNTNLSNQRGRK